MSVLRRILKATESVGTQMKIPGLFSQVENQRTSRSAPGGEEHAHGWNPKMGQFEVARGAPVGTVHRWAQGWMKKVESGEWVPVEVTPRSAMLEDVHRLDHEKLPPGSSLQQTTNGTAVLTVPVHAPGDLDETRWGVALKRGEGQFHRVRLSTGEEPPIKLVVRASSDPMQDLSRAAPELARMSGPGFTEPLNRGNLRRLQDMLEDYLKDHDDNNSWRTNAPWRQDFPRREGQAFILTNDSDQAHTPIALHFEVEVASQQDGSSTGVLTIQVGGNTYPVWKGPAHEMTTKMARSSGWYPGLDDAGLAAALTAIQSAYGREKGIHKLKFEKPKRGAPPEQAMGSWQTSRLKEEELDELAKAYTEKKLDPMSEEEHAAVFGKLPYSKKTMERMAEEIGYHGKSRVRGVQPQLDDAVRDFQLWLNRHHMAGGVRMTQSELLRILGIPDDFIVHKVTNHDSAGDAQKITIEAVHPAGDMAGGEVARDLFLNDDGTIKVHNAYFVCKKPGGYGAKMLLTQSQALLRLKHESGMREHPVIDVYAAGSLRSPTFDGYWIWAHLGYKIVSPDSSSGPPHGESYEELLSTPEGAAWWRRHGGAWEGEFDLKPKSYSLARLYWYCKDRWEKGALGAGAPKPKPPAQPSVSPLVEHENAIRARLQHIAGEGSDLSKRATGLLSKPSLPPSLVNRVSRANDVELHRSLRRILEQMPDHRATQAPTGGNRDAGIAPLPETKAETEGLSAPSEVPSFTSMGQSWKDVTPEEYAKRTVLQPRMTPPQARAYLAFRDAVEELRQTNSNAHKVRETKADLRRQLNISPVATVAQIRRHIGHPDAIDVSDMPETDSRTHFEAQDARFDELARRIAGSSRPHADSHGGLESMEDIPHFSDLGSDWSSITPEQFAQRTVLRPRLTPEAARIYLRYAAARASADPRSRDEEREARDELGTALGMSPYGTRSRPDILRAIGHPGVSSHVPSGLPDEPSHAHFDAQEARFDELVRRIANQKMAKAHPKKNQGDDYDALDRAMKTWSEMIAKRRERWKQQSEESDEQADRDHSSNR